MTWRADIAIGGSGDGQLICAGLEGKEVDALVLVERVRHGSQTYQCDLADSVRGRSLDNETPAVAELDRGLRDNGACPLKQVGRRKYLAIRVAVCWEIGNIDRGGELAAASAEHPPVR